MLRRVIAALIGLLAVVNGPKWLFDGKRLPILALTSLSTSADHQALGWRLMRPKGMEDLAAFSAREVKKAAAEERERDQYSFAEEQ